MLYLHYLCAYQRPHLQKPSFWKWGFRHMISGRNKCSVHNIEVKKVLVVQLCLTSCHPMDCSPPGFPVHEILQARILEWVAIPSPEDLPNPGSKPRSPALHSLPSEPPGKPVHNRPFLQIKSYITNKQQSCSFKARKYRVPDLSYIYTPTNSSPTVQLILSQGRIKHLGIIQSTNLKLTDISQPP